MTANQTGAELSSLSTALDDLLKRITAIAERHAGTRDDQIAQELFAVERSLNQAGRRLAKLAESLTQ